MKKNILKKIVYASMFLAIIAFALNPPLPDAILVNVKASTNPYNNYFNQYDNVINLSGVGEIVVAPDTAIIEIGVENLGKDLSVIQKENSDSMSNIIALLSENNIPKSNIRTRNFNFYKRYDYQNGQEFLGYTISNVISFKTNDFTNLTSLISKLTESGVNILNNIRFTIEDTSALYQKALKQAFDNAYSKLSNLVENPQDYTVINIKENNINGNFPVYELASFAKSDTLSNSIMAGEYTVSATISVSFAI